MGRLRKAGQAILNFDRRYAEALERENMPAAMQLGHAYPIEDLITKTTRQGPLGEISGRGPFKAGEHTPRFQAAASATGNASLLGANVLSRYGLPAGLAALGVKGLSDSMQLTPEQAEEFAQGFEASNMPEYAEMMRATQTSQAVMP
jgi:hypothetical protein